MSFKLPATLLVLVTASAASGQQPAPPKGGRVSAAWIDPRSYGAKGDGKTDDTAALRAAIEAARAAGGQLRIPPGVYLTEPLNLGSNQWIEGSGYEGHQATILRSRSGGHVFDISGQGYIRAIEISHLRIDGTGPKSGGSHGIYFHDNGPFGGPSHVFLHDLWISNCGGAGIFMAQEWHTTIENVTVDNCGGNLFDLAGGNTTTLVRTYAQRVAPGRAGYRIHTGGATLISANGIDPLGGDADWGVFGDSKASGDPADRYFRGVMMGCNVEDFTRRGIVLKGGAWVNLHYVVFQAPPKGTVTALESELARETAVADSATQFFSKGASWKDGYAIHSRNGPPLLAFGTQAPDHYWDDGAGKALPLPRIWFDRAAQGLVVGGALRQAAPLTPQGFTLTRGKGPPANGLWSAGDVVFNSSPAPGQPAGWMCVGGGSPGDWRAMAPLAP